jgi:uncharacterized Tic20 family protein
MEERADDRESYEMDNQVPSSDDRLWAMVAHVGGIAGMVLGIGNLGWLVPLVVWLAKRKNSAFVQFHALQALLFHVTWVGIYWAVWIAAVVTMVSSFGHVPMQQMWERALAAYVLFAMPGVLAVVPTILSGVAAIKAHAGEWYEYPMVGRFALRHTRV